MTIFITLVDVTLRGLVGRRRTVLLVLLAMLPIGLALLARLGGEAPDAAAALDALVVRIVLPLIALVFGTAALGAEIEDGTAVYLLTKPIARLHIVVAKVVVAALLTAALVAPSALATGLLMGGGDEGLAATLAVTPAVIIGSLLYAAAFVAVSVVTTRALVIGLVYVVIWEGILAGILVGTRIFSIREAVLGFAGVLAPDAWEGGLEAAQAVGLALVVVIGGVALGARRLAVHEIRGGD
jgi:ABC-2 type transport system permease protein